MISVESHLLESALSEKWLFGVVLEHVVRQWSQVAAPRHRSSSIAPHVQSVTEVER
jgi:hypothetical protein